MKKIKLTKGKEAIVDDEDFEYLNQFHWFINDNGYAVTTINKRKVRMHRFINKTPDGLDTDHINRNKIDNRRENLRNLTRSQNNMNTGLWRHNTSGEKGVNWDKDRKKWKSRIQVNGKSVELGRYTNIWLALLVRKKAEELFFNL